MKLSFQPLIPALLLFLGSSETGLAESASNSSSNCRLVPESSQNSPVEVCESETSYSIKIGDQVDEYDKHSFQDYLKEEVQSWIESTEFPTESLCNSAVKFWLSVPEANPFATQARVEITNTYSNFLIYLSPRAEDWNISNDKVSILNEEIYPDSYGYASTTIIIKSKKGVDKVYLDQYLARFSAIPGDRISGLWYSYSVSAFEEEKILQQIEADPFSKFFIEDTGTNYGFEWISAKESVFEFNWNCN